MMEGIPRAKRKSPVFNYLQGAPKEIAQTGWVARPRYCAIRPSRALHCEDKGIVQLLSCAHVATRR
jgi:hypothetical protein